MPSQNPRRLGRRVLLISAGSLGLVASVTACGGGADTSFGPSVSPDPREDPPADAVRREVATAERGLIAAYDAVLTAFPSLSKDLTPIRAQHADHLAAMAEEGAQPPAAPVPASVAAGFAELRAAEQRAARQRRTSCVAAGDPELARVLALIAASEQSHAAALRGMAGS